MGNGSQDIASNSGWKDHIILLEISTQDLALFLRKPFLCSVWDSDVSDSYMKPFTARKKIIYA